jgi:hypothetical protein
MLDIALALSRSEVTGDTDRPLESSAPILARTSTQSKRCLGELPDPSAAGYACIPPCASAHIPDTSEDVALAWELHQQEQAAAAVCLLTHTQCAYTCFTQQLLTEVRVAPSSVFASCCHFLPHDTDKVPLHMQAAVAAPSTAGQVRAALISAPRGPENNAPCASLSSPSTAIPRICSGCNTRLVRSPFPGFSAFGMEAEYMMLPGCPGKAFHLGCLICTACKTTLTVRDKVAVDGIDYYHEHCLRKKRRPICACCNEHISSEVRPGAMVSLSAHTWRTTKRARMLKHWVWNVFRDPRCVGMDVIACIFEDTGPPQNTVWWRHAGAGFRQH